MAQKSKKKGKENKNQNSTRFPIVRGNVDYFIVVVTLILLCLGLIMLLSASAPTSISESGNSYSYFKRQIFYLCIYYNITIFSRNNGYGIWRC